MSDNSASQPAVGPAESGDAAAASLTPLERKRLEKLFAHAKERTTKEQYDYAHELLGQCVRKDPSNLVYVEAMMDNLQTKFSNNKKGGRTKGNRSEFKKAISGGDWTQVISEGLELLLHNPWDVPTLRGIAQACEALHFNEVELRYLKNALDANPKDIEVNKHCATSLARMGQFDQAIACWRRIEEINRNLAEPSKMIGELLLAKQRHIGGVGVDDEPTEGGNAKTATAKPTRAMPTRIKPEEPRKAGSADTDRAADADVATGASGQVGDVAVPQLSRQEQLERAIVKEPTVIANYLQLAELFSEQESYADAERVLTRALAASGNDFQVRERLEDAQVRRLKHLVTTLEHEAAQQPTEELRENLQRRRADLNRLELEILTGRHQRYPKNVEIKHELGLRLKRAGNFAEAVKFLDESAQVPDLAAVALLEAGECRQHLRKYQDALKCYLAAAKAAQEADPERFKLSLYRAGVLAAGLKAWDQAEKLLGRLLRIDPNYRDAAARLDKVRESRQN
ncbi:MAG: hypothetical protein R3E01_21060 [Pirellulaceae bacterium]|nr:hypothetical protein [Planctomycetales bacterium]